jgi:hypothetical protein
MWCLFIFVVFLTLLDIVSFYEESVMRIFDSPIFITLLLVFAVLYFGIHFIRGVL